MVASNFGHLLSKIGSRLSSFDSNDVDDALQDVFVRLLERDDSPDLEGDDLIRWLIVCVRRKLIDNKRRASRSCGLDALPSDPVQTESTAPFAIVFERELADDERQAIERTIARQNGELKDTTSSEYFKDYRTMRRIRRITSVVLGK